MIWSLCLLHLALGTITFFFIDFSDTSWIGLSKIVIQTTAVSMSAIIWAWACRLLLEIGETMRNDLNNTMDEQIRQRQRDLDDRIRNMQAMVNEASQESLSRAEEVAARLTAIGQAGYSINEIGEASEMSVAQASSQLLQTLDNNRLDRESSVLDRDKEADVILEKLKAKDTQQGEELPDPTPESPKHFLEVSDHIPDSFAVRQEDTEGLDVD